MPGHPFLGMNMCTCHIHGEDMAHSCLNSKGHYVPTLLEACPCLNAVASLEDEGLSFLTVVLFNSLLLFVVLKLAMALKVPLKEFILNNIIWAL